MPPRWCHGGGNRTLSSRLRLVREGETGRNYTAACKDYQEKTWVGVSSTITESDSPSAASRGYCGYFA